MRKKEHLDTQPIGIRFPKGQIEHLKQVARLLAVEKKKDITYSDLIREAVEKNYPMKKSKK